METEGSLETVKKLWCATYLKDQSKLPTVSSLLKKYIELENDEWFKQHRVLCIRPLAAACSIYMVTKNDKIMYVGYSFRKTDDLIKGYSPEEDLERGKLCQVQDDFPEWDEGSLKVKCERGLFDLLLHETPETLSSPSLKIINTKVHFLAATIQEAIQQRDRFLTLNGFKWEEPICPLSSYVRIVRN